MIMLLSLISANAFAVNTDSLFQIHLTDSLKAAKKKLDQDSLNKMHQRNAELFNNWKISNQKIDVVANTGQSVYHIESEFSNQFQDWLFYIMISLLIFLAFIKLKYHKEFDDLFSILKTVNRNQQNFKTKATGVPWISVMLNIFTVLIISIFIWLLIQYLKIPFPFTSWQLLSITLILVLISVAIRFVSMQIIAAIFSSVKEIKFYSFYEMELIRVLAIIIFPIDILCAFGNHFVQGIAFLLSAFILILFLAFRFMKGMQLGSTYLMQNKFHFIIYICSLEIAPLLLLIKFVLTWQIH